MIFRFLLVTLIILGVAPAMGGTIFLKDGAMVESEKIWERDGYIHFILNGTKRVEIRYAKEIVDRIEGGPELSGNWPPGASQLPNNVSNVPPISDHDPASLSQNLPTDASINTEATDKYAGKNSALPPEYPVHREKTTRHKALRNVRQDKVANGIYSIKTTGGEHGAPPKPKLSKQETSGAWKHTNSLKGIAFYDPRRKEKYWSSKTSHHQTITSAVAALAEVYNQPPSWVIANMGNTNDLGIIHQNLTESTRRNPPVAQGPITSGVPSAKISKNNRHAAAKLFNPSPNMIKSQKETPSKIAEDILFYDPHRPLKYWSDQKTGHHTFSEAIKSLSQTYHRPPQWIETHMGRFNNLAQIHENLRQSLQQ